MDDLAPGRRGPTATKETGAECNAVKTKYTGRTRLLGAVDAVGGGDDNAKALLGSVAMTMIRVFLDYLVD
jgi:hypothetical protein